MKYISSEQFNQADKKAQSSIMSWWKPEEYDFVYREGCDYIDIVAECYGNEIRVINEDYHMSKNTFIPLLTTSQLIDYIEFKLGCTVGVEYNDRNMNVILVAYYVLDCIDNSVEKSKQEFNTDDLIRALWECVQEINK